MSSLGDKIPNLEIKIYRGHNYEFKKIEGSITFNSWKDYQSRRGVYNSVDINQQSDGSFRLDIGGNMTGEDPQISNDHINAYNYLMQHQEKIKEIILETLLTKYKSLQEEYGYNSEEHHQ